MLGVGVLINLVGIAFVMIALNNLPIDIWCQLIFLNWNEINPYI